MEGELTFGNGAHIKGMLMALDIMEHPPDEPVELFDLDEMVERDRQMGIVPEDDEQEQDEEGW